MNNEYASLDFIMDSADVLIRTQRITVSFFPENESSMCVFNWLNKFSVYTGLIVIPDEFSGLIFVPEVFFFRVDPCPEVHRP